MPYLAVVDGALIHYSRVTFYRNNYCSFCAIGLQYTVFNEGSVTCAVERACAGNPVSYGTPEIKSEIKLLLSVCVAAVQAPGRLPLLQH